MTNSIVRPIVLTIPANSSYLRLVRLVVASMGADAAFDIEAVEDLRIAADELVTAVLSAAQPECSIAVELLLHDGYLSLSAQTVGGETPARLEGATTDDSQLALDPLAAHILSELVDEHAFMRVGKEFRGSFRKAVPGL